MVSSRKRGRQEMEPAETPREHTLLDRIRNMWEFANLAQWIFIFGRAVKIDENLDIEELEMECLKSHSTVLPEVGLALLKFVSSHRGLTPEIFDEYTRRQYVAKAPHRNPFGIEEEPAKFSEFNVFTKIRVLQQLTQWTMGNHDRIRERMEEQKDTEQTIWRIEPFGWDSEDRTYIVLDDNRIYRRTDPPPPLTAPRPKKNSKKAKAALRASKRRKVSETVDSHADRGEEEAVRDPAEVDMEDDGFGGMKWELIAVTLDEINSFLASIMKSRDPNEKALHKRIVDEVLPVLEKQEEARKRKAAHKERELLNLEKLATAKRSSRIAGKLEQQKLEEESREAERKKAAELAMAKKEQDKWMKLEKERESRMMTREQRLKEREARRILHEEELANLSEDNKKLESGEGRLSERHLKAEIEKKKQALEDLADEEDWIFDCICGVYGQVDDGTHSVACEKCNIWQHSKCVGVSQAEADRDDFHFICKTCKRRAEDAERAKTHPPIKIKLNRPGSSSSPIPPKKNSLSMVAAQPVANGMRHLHLSPQKVHHVAQGAPVPESYFPKSNGQQVDQRNFASVPSPRKIDFSSQGFSESPRHTPQSNGQQIAPTPRPENFIPPGDIYDPRVNVGHSPGTIGYGSGAHYTQQTPHGGGQSPSFPSNGIARPSSGHAFSSPHPLSPINLPPPTQPQSYSSVNGDAPRYSHTSVIALPGQRYATGTPTQSNFSRYPPMQTPESQSPGHNYRVPPSPGTFNGQYHATDDSAHRRSSVNLPSPLSSAEMLYRSNPADPAASYPVSSIAGTNYKPKAQSTVFTPTQPGPSPSMQAGPLQQNQAHASALPPAITGLSPTKHSPPRPSTANSNLGSVTPSVLPPVAPLSPSPRLQDLTPPVKPSEPERSRPTGQILNS